jgi:uncharacterized protein YkvS
MYKEIIKIILILLAGLVFGYFIAYIQFSNSAQPVAIKSNLQMEKDIQNVLTQAKNSLKERGIASPAGSEEYYKDVVNGEISKINSNSVIIKSIPFEIISNPDLDLREVKISDESKIVLIKTKDEIDYQAETEEFYKNNPDLKDTGFIPEDYPSKFYDEEGGMADLKVGQKVTVKAGGEILNEKSFVAMEIHVVVD